MVGMLLHRHPDLTEPTLDQPVLTYQLVLLQLGLSELQGAEHALDLGVCKIVFLLLGFVEECPALFALDIAPDTLDLV